MCVVDCCGCECGEGAVGDVLAHVGIDGLGHVDAIEVIDCIDQSVRVLWADKLGGRNAFLAVEDSLEEGIERLAAVVGCGVNEGIDFLGQGCWEAVAMRSIPTDDDSLGRGFIRNGRICGIDTEIWYIERYVCFSLLYQLVADEEGGGV